MTGIITHEESQEVTKAFRALGHEFYSNDLQPCSGGRPEWHIQADCFDAVFKVKDLNFLGMHPVCRYLANSGVRWLTSETPRKGYAWCDNYQIYMNWPRYELMILAAKHFLKCLDFVQDVGVGYVENPIMHKYAMEIIEVQPTQIVQPWMFGHMERKATCFWFIGLDKLEETNNVYDEMIKLPKKETDKVHYASPGPEREKERSKTKPGIAAALAQQFSNQMQLV